MSLINLDNIQKPIYFTWSPGNPPAREGEDGVYSNFSELYAASSGSGSVYVIVDATGVPQSSPPFFDPVQLPAGTYDLSKFWFYGRTKDFGAGGGQGLTVQIPDGVTLTGLPTYFEFMDFEFTNDSAVVMTQTGVIISRATFGTYRVSGLYDVIDAIPGPPVFLLMNGGNITDGGNGRSMVNMSGGATLQMFVRNGSQINHSAAYTNRDALTAGGAVDGTGTITCIHDSTVNDFETHAGYDGSITNSREEKAQNQEYTGIYGSQISIKEAIEAVPAPETEEFIFRPGGPAGGNVYTTIDTLFAAVEASSKTFRRIIVDMPGLLQTHTYSGADLTSQTDWSNVSMIPTKDTISPTIKFEAEVTFGKWFGHIDNVTLEFSNTVGPVTTISTSEIIFFETDAANFKAENIGVRSVSQPVWQVSGSGAQLLIIAGGRANIFSNTREAIDIGSSGLVEFTLADGARVQSDYVRDTASPGGTLQWRLPDLGSEASTTQTNFTGSVTYPVVGPLSSDNQIYDTIFFDGSRWDKRRNNVSTSDPTINDDETAGYDRFSFWINSGTGAVFILRNETTGAADWVDITATGGGGTPGGSDGQVQYNNGGAFGGDPALNFDDTTKTLGLLGSAATARHQVGSAGDADWFQKSFSLDTADALSTTAFSIPVAAGEMVMLEVFFVAAATDSFFNQANGWKITGVVRNDQNTNPFKVVQKDYQSNEERPSVDTLDADLVYTGGNLELVVTGRAAETIKWRGIAKYVKMTGLPNDTGGA